MDLSLQRLLARARPMGNPSRKYVHILKRNGDRLLDRLEASGHLSRVHIDRAAPRVAEDFGLVAHAGSDPGEKLQLLGTFYAIQYLHLNSRALERLALEIAEDKDPVRAYASYLSRVEEDFGSLISTYMSRVLRIVLPPALRGRFVICAVGTMLHQDDIDVMVVVEPGMENRDDLDAAVARLGDQMLRYASILDHYLAGQVSTEGFAVTPAEIGARLRGPQFNYVLVTELLRAVPLVGGRRHFRNLQDEVIEEYYHHADGLNHRHELYLRGILGEVRSLMLRPPPPEFIHPKDDAQRMIMSLTNALKTVTGLRATRTRELLRGLRRRRPGLEGPLRDLEKGLVFIETVRQLAQLFIAQEDEIETGGKVARENIRRVARAMGFHDRGPVRADDFLLVHYHEAVDTVRRAVEPIMQDVAKHLGRIGRISRWTRTQDRTGSLDDFATAVAAGLQSFRGVRFWDDFLEMMAAPDRRLIDALSASFRNQDEGTRRRLAEIYSEWGRNAPFAFLTVLTLLGRKDPATLEIVDVFLEVIDGDPESVRSLARVHRYYPDLMNRALLMLDADRQARLEEALAVEIGNPEVARARDRFRFLVGLHRTTSRYVKRVLERLTVRYPATILALDRPSKLRVLALGRLAAAERQPKTEDQKDYLGDYYDMEFLRISTRTLLGVEQVAVSDDFAELTRTYLAAILDVAVREAEKAVGSRLAQRDRVAVILAGGNARGRPFDEDYDLIVLVDSNDPAVLRIAEAAVVRFNRQIARRGVIAQYRLAEHFGRFSTTVDELAGLLDVTQESLFVDCCQVLNSRLVVGSRRVEKALMERVIRPHLFERSQEFLTQVVREVREHRAGFKKTATDVLHLKEMPGGLREIDLCLVAAKACCGVRDTRGSAVFGKLAEADPERASAYETLTEASDFLMALRSAYRVSVAASDFVEREWLGEPARILARAGMDLSGPDELFERIASTGARSMKAIETVLAGLADSG